MLHCIYPKHTRERVLGKCLVRLPQKAAGSHFSDSSIATSASSGLFFAVAANFICSNVQCWSYYMLFWTRNTYMTIVFRSPHNKTIIHARSADLSADPRGASAEWTNPFVCMKLFDSQSPSYGVYISQLIRYARASTLYDDFLSRSCRLTSKLLRQGYERFKLISAFKKFYGRHKIIVDRYKVSVTHIISDLFLETLYRSWLTCYYGSLLCMFDRILIYVHFYNG